METTEENSNFWKDIEGYEGLYQANKIGLIKSIAKKNPMILQAYLDSSGYPSVRLSKDGRSRSFKLHRLIATAFIPNPENYPQVDHINAIKVDACYTNLRWCTAKMNIRYSVALLGNKNRLRGEDNNMSKLTADNVREMRELFKTGNYLKKELAVKYGISRINASLVINGQSWTHI